MHVAVLLRVHLTRLLKQHDLIGRFLVPCALRNTLIFSCQLENRLFEFRSHGLCPLRDLECVRFLCAIRCLTLLSGDRVFEVIRDDWDYVFVVLLLATAERAAFSFVLFHLLVL